MATENKLSAIMRIMTVVSTMVFLLLAMSCAFAEDLNAKSDEELLALYQEIQAILLARNGNYTVELASGKYTIGTDFPAGSYRIEAKGAYSSTQVKVYKNADEKYPSESYILAELYQSSVIGKLDVVSGNVLEIAGSVVTVSAYNAAQTPLNITVETDSLKDANQADTEMVDGLVVPSGKYLIGSEIAPGTYRVVCEEAYGMASVSVFDSEKAVFPSFNTLLSPLLGNAEIGKLDLKSGSYLEVSEGSVTLYVYKGLGK